jgi:hypothetical protein
MTLPLRLLVAPEWVNEVVETDSYSNPISVVKIPEVDVVGTAHHDRVLVSSAHPTQLKIFYNSCTDCYIAIQFDY